MWSLWVIPLLTGLFVAGIAAAIITAIIIRPQTMGARIGLAIAPVGCVALPLLALAALIGISALLQKSDAALFEELFGFRPEMGEDAMLSDDFGTWSDRAIYMRTEPSAHDRQRMIDVMHGPADITPAQFAVYGESRPFSWWHTQCEVPRILAADGYRGWTMLRVLDCPERGTLYIVALRP